MQRFLLAIGLILGLLMIVGLCNTLNYGTPTRGSYDKVLVDLERQDIPQRLANAIKIRTISEQNIADINYESFLELHRFIDVEFPLVTKNLDKKVIGAYSLLYVWKGSDPTLKPVLLLSHMDVVPVVAGTEPLWEHGPFSGDIANGYIWGRGALDDKLGVFAILEAVEQLLLQGYEPKRSFYLAFGHDEERGGVDGAGQIAKYLKAKGIQALFVLDEGGFITNGGIFGLDKPIAMVNVSEKGYVSLELSVKGEGGHSSMPPAETAATVLSQAVVSVSENKFPLDTSVFETMMEPVAQEMPFYKKAVLANIGMLAPMISGLVEQQPQFNALVRTTTAPTMLLGSPKENVLPIYAKAIINHRILPGETVASTKEFVVKAIANEQVSVAIINQSNDPSPVSSVISKAYQAIEKTIQETVEQEILVVPGILPAATDSKYYAEISDDTYRFVFAEINMSENRFHGTNERIGVESYMAAVRFYVRLVENSDQL
ncbi:MAG: M20/M25/M40 family metallo-hydrolase [Pseudomonadales bacterium]|nr:M20/M25/M40 family metallo-hydrolase [Pseudomonadales bacterium]